MTVIIELTLKFTSSNELLVLAKSEGEELQVYTEVPEEAPDLIKELKSGKAIKSALEQAQYMVTELLFPGKIADLIQSKLAQTQGSQGSENFTENTKPVLLLLVDSPDALQTWPWELVLNPITGQALLLESVELVRIIGKLPSLAERNGLSQLASGRVHTKASEVFKFSAMRAATSHIARKFKVQVSPIHSRNDLHRNSEREIRLFNHVYAVDKKGLVTLESEVGQGPLSIGDSAIAQESILLNITPPVPQSEVAKARRSGSYFVIARQFEQSVKTRAESDRALYHALGSGYSIPHAMHWARKALYQSEPNSYQWATLTLNSGYEHEYAMLLSDFPPKLCAAIEPLQSKPTTKPQDTDDQQGLVEGQALLSRKGRRSALSVQSFVQQTVQLIQKSQRDGLEVDKVNLALRTPMMRQLSTIVQKRKIPVDPQLPRSAQLSQQLIEAGYIADEALRLPSQWYGRAERLATALGLQVDPVAQSTKALVASPAIWVCGADETTRLLYARGLCEEVFQAFPYEQSAFSESCSLEDELSALTKLSWEDALDETKATKRRQMMIAFHEESQSWRRYRRAFMLISQAHQLPRDQHESLLVALRSQYVQSKDQEDLHLPRETRVIFVSEFMPSESLDGLVIHLSFDAETLKPLWTRELRTLLLEQGVDSVLVEERLNDEYAQSFMSILTLCIRLELVHANHAFDALHYGLLTGADQASIAEALELYVHPHLGEKELAKDCLISYMQQDQDGFEASWLSLYPELTPPELPLKSIGTLAI